MGIAAIALQGLEQASAQLDQAASNLVQSATGSATSSGDIDTVDLATQIVSLNSAQTQFELSIDTLKTANQIQQNLVNELA